jgi:tetratricopeptide (TPR) repeat protein
MMDTWVVLRGDDVMSRLVNYLCGVKGQVVCATVLILLLGGVVTAADDSAAEQGQAETAASSLSQIGIDLESARQVSAAGDRSSLQAVVSALTKLDGDGVPSHQRDAAHMLWGEVHQELGAYGQAVQDYKKAVKESDDKALKAAAAFLQIQALEAAGEDEDAAKAWHKWLKKYAASSLKPEAELRLIWNRIRGGNLEEAGEALGELAQLYPWLTSDSRFRLTQATMDFLQNRPNDALVSLGKDTEGAAATYLRALCYEANADILKAAAAYQEVAVR